MYTNKDFENEIARNFIDWLNKKHNLDFKDYIEKEKNSPTDIFATSARKRSKILLQITTSEGELSKRAWENTRNKKLSVGDINLIDWIKNVINKKYNHYSPEARKEMILLISADTLSGCNQQYLLKNLKKFSKLDFKGIYLIERAESSHIQKNYYKEGLVLTLKSV